MLATVIAVAVVLLRNAEGKITGGGSMLITQITGMFLLVSSVSCMQYSFQPKTLMKSRLAKQNT